MGNLYKLWHLSLGYNQLSKLPDSFHQLKNLTFFSIEENEFETFPRAILGMENVGNLWMHANKITELSLIHISEPTRPY